MPDHLKDDDEFDKMKQEISEGFGLKVDPHSYDETAVLRNQIQHAQSSGPVKPNLGALGMDKSYCESAKYT